MKAMIFAFLFLGSVAQASVPGYLLKLDLSINHKHVAASSMLVKAGEVGTVTQKTDSGTTYIDALAMEGQLQGKSGILIQFTVGRLNAKGERVDIASPQVLVNENKEARVSMRHTGKDSERISISVVAARKTL